MVHLAGVDTNVGGGPIGLLPLNPLDVDPELASVALDDLANLEQCDILIEWRKGMTPTNVCLKSELICFDNPGSMRGGVRATSFPRPSHLKRFVLQFFINVHFSS